MPTARDTLDHAAALLADGGPAGITVRRVADALGVSRQVVYTHFGGKDGLLLALRDEGFDRLADRVASVGAPPGSNEQMVGIGLAYRRAALEAPELYRLMFNHPDPAVAGAVPEDSAAARSFGVIVDAAADWLQEHTPDGSTSGAHRLARMCWTAAHGQVALELAGHPRAEPERELEDLVRAVLAGVLRVSA